MPLPGVSLLGLSPASEVPTALREQTHEAEGATA
jgi:hypothetical protein